MKRLTAVFVMILGVVMYSNAQARKLTDSDLQKFRAKRLAAEKDLRENYSRMGFPSPEEIEKQRGKDVLERIALGEKLKAERLERERFEAEQQRLAIQAAAVASPNYIVVERQDNGGYLWGYSVVGSRRFPWHSPNPFRGIINWRAGGGGGVIYEPGGSSFVRTPVFGQRLRPIWIPPRRH